MRERLLFFISAARDLRLERDVIARAVTEIPTTLGWTIKQTPPASRESDLVAVARADVHVLLLGRDIQAPVGLEWAAARRAGRAVALFVHDVPQTQAASGFMREVNRQRPSVGPAWERFKDAHDLRLKVLRLLGEHLLAHAIDYDLGDAAQGRLCAWLAALTDKPGPDLRAADETGGVILSTERYMPKEGKLITGARA
jgi:hypothetical protein